MGVTRRDLLRGAGGMAAALVFGGPVAGAMAEASKIKGDRSRRSSRRPGIWLWGHRGPAYQSRPPGGVLYLNDGAWPPTDAATRIAEAKKACEILKATPAYAGQTNGHAIVDNPHYEEYVKLIGAEKPDAVITQWPIDNHRDHRAITMLTYDAWRQSKHKFALYYYEVSDGEDTLQFSPTHYVDITETGTAKRAACSPTPARLLTGTTRCKTRWRCFAKKGIQTGGGFCAAGAEPR